MSGFESGAISYISSAVQEVINSASTAVGGMLSAVSPFAQKAFIFLILYTGLRLFFGYADLKEVQSSFFKILFVFSIIFGFSIGYSDYIIPAIYGTREFLGDAIVSNDSATIYKSMDLLVDRGIAISQVAYNSSDILSPRTYPYLLYAIGTIICCVVLVMIMAFVMLGAEIILIFLTAIGPFFIISFLYSSTRNFFFLWISATFANIILFVIGSFFIGFAANGINQIIDKEGIIDKISAIEQLKYTSPLGFNTMTSIQLQSDKNNEMNDIQDRLKTELKNSNCDEFPQSDYRPAPIGADPGSKAWQREPSVCNNIRNKYQIEINNLDTKYKNLESKAQKDEIQKHKTLKNIAEEPIAHAVFIGIILFFSILIKITFEIPSLAQTLSGGAGVGASAAALGVAVAQKAKGFTRRATGLAIGASVAAIKSRRQPLKSTISNLNKTLTKLNENVEKQTTTLSEVANLRQAQTPAAAGLFAYGSLERPNHAKIDNHQNNVVTTNANNSDGTKQIESKNQSSPSSNSPANNPNPTSQVNNPSTPPTDGGITANNPPASASGDIKTTGDANINRVNINGRSSEHAGRNLPSHAANAASGAIESQRREEISNQTRTSSQESPRSNDNDGENK